MTTPKYTDPAVQNRTQDNATDHINELQQKIAQPARQKNETDKADDKRKGYKEGNRDDSIRQDADDNA